MEKHPLKIAGLKVTLPRMKILALLSASTRRHFSVEDIYQDLRDMNQEISLATIYRVLTQFEAAGLVIKHYFTKDHCVFELNQGRHHDHLVCVFCKKVVEFEDAVIEARQQALTERFGFSMKDHILTIYGVCGDCQSGDGLIG